MATIAREVATCSTDLSGAVVALAMSGFVVAVGLWFPPVLIQVWGQLSGTSRSTCDGSIPPADDATLALAPAPASVSVMLTPYIHENGILNAPYFIYVECGERYTDEELMALLDIAGYGEYQPSNWGCTHLYIANDGRWAHVIDDWGYALYHSRRVRAGIERVAVRHNVFVCLVGDSDESWFFTFYENSKLRRRYVVEDPAYQGGTVTVDEGEPLAAEREGFQEPEHLAKVMKLARSLGVDTRYESSRLRYYSRHLGGLKTWQVE